MPKHRNLKSSQLSCEPSIYQIGHRGLPNFFASLQTAAGWYCDLALQAAVMNRRCVTIVRWLDSYTTDMAAYETDRGECINIATQAQVETS